VEEVGENKGEDSAVLLCWRCAGAVLAPQWRCLGGGAVARWWRDGGAVVVLGWQRGHGIKRALLLRSRCSKNNYRVVNERQVTVRGARGEARRASGEWRGARRRVGEGVINMVRASVARGRAALAHVRAWGASSLARRAVLVKWARDLDLDLERELAPPPTIHPPTVAFEGIVPLQHGLARARGKGRVVAIGWVR